MSQDVNINRKNTAPNQRKLTVYKEREELKPPVIIHKCSERTGYFRNLASIYFVAM